MIFGIAVMLAQKFFSDKTFDKKAWSKILKIDIKNLIELEIEFLKAINYELFITEKEYILWVYAIENMKVNFLNLNKI